MPITIAVAIPTIGRPSLMRALQAIASQMLLSGDEVFVVKDTHTLPKDDQELKASVESFGPQFKYLEHDAGLSFKGVFQTNLAFKLAKADLVLAHSDDDVFTEGAFSRLRWLAEGHPNRPIVFRTVSPRGNVTWYDGQPGLRRHSLGGGSLAAPRCFLKPFHYPCEGIDYYWVCEVLALAAASGHLPIWTDEILMRSRNRERRT